MNKFSKSVRGINHNDLGGELSARRRHEYGFNPKQQEDFMYKPHTLLFIAVMIWLLGVLTVGCSHKQSTSVDEATAGSNRSSRDQSKRQTHSPSIEHSSGEDPRNSATIAVRTLPTNSFNTTIRGAASNNASWTADPEQIALRFWQEHVRDPYAEHSDDAEPQIARLPISGEEALYIDFRMTNGGGGDDSIAHEWTDLRLRRDARTGLWQIEQATTSAECLRGVAEGLCL